MNGGGRIGIALQLTDVVRRRVVGGREYPASVGTAGEVVELAQRLDRHFGHLWLSDNLGYRNTTVLLAGIAAATTDMGLGTFTAYPYGRSPVDTASSLATVQELMNGRDLAYGISRGSRAVTDLYRGERPLHLLREHIATLRSLLAGGDVSVDDVPEVARVHGLRPGRRLQTQLDPVNVPVLVASTGPRTLRLAGEVADGIQFVTQQPTQSAALLDDPSFPVASGLAQVDAGLEESRRDGPFRRVYGIAVSVAADPDDAVDFARRQVAGVLATKREEQLVAVGIDPDIGRRVRAAMDGGAGLEEASAQVPKAVVRRLIATGPASEVAEQIGESIDRSRKWGFEEHFLCFPLGPDIKDAVDTLVADVLPSLRVGAPTRQT